MLPLVNSASTVCNCLRTSKETANPAAGAQPEYAALLYALSFIETLQAMP
jgi:hypothetical protein